MKKVLAALAFVIALFSVVMISGCSGIGNLAGTIYQPDYEMLVDGHSYGRGSFGAAWKEANENPDKTVVIVCNKDTIATDGKFGEYDQLTVVPRTAPLTLDLNGHTIDRGLESPINSGAVFSFFNQTGTITIKNGTIKGGNNKDLGGGIYIDSDTLNITLENVTITGNHSGYSGGGMHINGCNANVTLKDVTVTGNSSAYCGGVHWDSLNGKMASLTMSGNVNITDNTGTGEADFSNFVISEFPSNTVRLQFADLSEGSVIKIAHEEDIGIPFTSNLGENAAKYQKCFVSERTGLFVAVDENNALYLAVDEKNNTRVAAGVYRDSWGYWQYFTDASIAWRETDSHKAPVTMKLYKDWVGVDGNLGTGNGFHDGAILPYSRDIDQELTLDLNGHTINRNLQSAKKNGCIFYMDDDYNPHITVKNGTLTGGRNTEQGGAIHYSADHGVFWLINVKITGNHSISDGGAIYYMSERNWLCLKDVEITGNYSLDGYTSAKYGGALYATVFSLKTDKLSYLNFYGKIIIKYNNRGDFHLDKGEKMHFNFSDDIEPNSIWMSVTDLNEFKTSEDHSKFAVVESGDVKKAKEVFGPSKGWHIEIEDGNCLSCKKD